MTYNFYLARLTDGQVVADVDLVGFSGKRHLQIGDMSASMSWVDITRREAEDLQEFTTPGKYTVVVERNGIIAGEWIIWKRQRSNDNGLIQLTGAEVLSFLDRRMVHSFSAQGFDQFEIADELALGGFGSLNLPGRGVALLRPDNLTSGVTRTYRYYLAEATYGQRLRELSELIDGFDYYIDTTWATTGASRKVVRTLKFGYPTAGVNTPYQLTMGEIEQGINGEALHGGGNVLGITVAEDGTRLAQRVYAIGSGQGPTRLIGDRTTQDLFNKGYPYMTASKSWTSVTRKTTIDKHADELLRSRQTSELPPSIVLFADGDPAFGTYGLGDRMNCTIEPSPNFPTGYSSLVRVMGWQLAPATNQGEDDANEVIALDILGADS